MRAGIAIVGGDGPGRLADRRLGETGVAVDAGQVGPADRPVLVEQLAGAIDGAVLVAGLRFLQALDRFVHPVLLLPEQRQVEPRGRVGRVQLSGTLQLTIGTGEVAFLAPRFPEVAAEDGAAGFHRGRGLQLGASGGEITLADEAKAASEMRRREVGVEGDGPVEGRDRGGGAVLGGREIAVERVRLGVPRRELERAGDRGPGGGDASGAELQLGDPRLREAGTGRGRSRSAGQPERAGDVESRLGRVSCRQQPRGGLGRRARGTGLPARDGDDLAERRRRFGLDAREEALGLGGLADGQAERGAIGLLRGVRRDPAFRIRRQRAEQVAGGVGLQRGAESVAAVGRKRDVSQVEDARIIERPLDRRDGVEQRRLGRGLAGFDIALLARGEADAAQFVAEVHTAFEQGDGRASVLGDADGDLGAEDGPGSDRGLELVLVALLAVEEVEAAFTELDLETVGGPTTGREDEVGELVDAVEGLVADPERGAAIRAGAEGVAELEDIVGPAGEIGVRAFALHLDLVLDGHDAGAAFAHDGLGGHLVGDDQARCSQGQDRPT